MISHPFSGIEVLIRDFSQVRPREATSREALPGKWRLVPWQGRSACGEILFGYPERLPRVTLALGATGWYAISIGIWRPLFTNSIFRLRVRGERSWSSLTLPVLTNFKARHEEPYRFLEYFWRFANLADTCIEIELEQGLGGLAFVRLIPLSEDQIRAIREPRHIPWMWTDDALDLFMKRRRNPLQVVAEAIDPFRESDFSDLSWCVLEADITKYETAIGTQHSSSIAGRLSPDVGSTIRARNIDRALATGIDPDLLAAKLAEDSAIGFWVAQRMQPFALEPPWDTIWLSRYRLGNPQWACRARDGRPLMQMSFAYPEVRRHLLDMQAEFLARMPRHPAGIHLIFNRGVPYSLFEEPVLTSFRRLYGADIRELPPWDPRVVSCRAQFLTAFLEEERAMLRSNGFGDLKIAANVFQNERMNDEYGLNVSAWAERSLVDRVLVFQWEHRWEEPIDFDFWRSMMRDSQREFYFYAYNHNMHGDDTPQQIRQRVLRNVRSGAKAMCAWDAPPRLVSLGVSRLGELEVWETIRPADIEQVMSLGDYAVDEFPTFYAT